MSKKVSGYITEVKLGSNGRLYNDLLPDGIVTCTPWGTGEEMLLQSPINQQTLMDKLIKACCDLPDGLEPEDLTLYDRFHLFLHQRCISYPRPYQFNFKCEECNKKSTANISLQDDLEVVKLGEDVAFTNEPIATHLPCLDVDVGWKFLRGKDEKMIANYEKRVRSKHPNMIGDPTYKYRIARRIVSIDGSECKLQDAMNLVEKMLSPDSLVLRDSFDEYMHGPKLEIEVECKMCGWGNEIDLPFDKSFFRPRK